MPPQGTDQRRQVTIEGVTNPTVLAYVNNLNANDFETLIDLFAPDGALQSPMVGKANVLRFFQEDCQTLNLIPERGVAEPTDDGFT